MIKLRVMSIQKGMQVNTGPSFSGVVSSDESDSIPLDDQDIYNAKHLDILIAHSRYDEIKKYASNKDCDLHLNLFPYPKIPLSSVKSMESLTKMELLILSELATGDTLDVIAKRNHIAHTTVKKHADHIYEKLNVKNKCQAVSVYNLFLLEHPEEALAESKIKPN